MANVSLAQKTIVESDPILSASDNNEIDIILISPSFSLLFSPALIQLQPLRMTPVRMKKKAMSGSSGILRTPITITRFAPAQKRRIASGMSRISRLGRRIRRRGR